MDDSSGGLVFLAFLLLLALILVSYYVGTASDLLIGGKTIQQLAFFFTARNSNGVFASNSTVLA